jgi:hypothetical protein
MATKNNHRPYHRFLGRYSGPDRQSGNGVRRRTGRPHAVALNIIGAAMKKVFLQYFPNPVQTETRTGTRPYGVHQSLVCRGNVVDMFHDA